MGLEKAIASGKERRKPYADSRSFDSACRNHGVCPWCEGNRKHQHRQQEEAARQERAQVVTTEKERV